MSKIITYSVASSLAAAVISAFSGSASAATASNSVSENSITVDANISDWSSVSSFGYDASTLVDVNAQANYVEGWMAHDSNSLYVAYRNSGDINIPTWWAWQVYIDTDLVESTGFTGVSGVGAEYILQGSGLYEYTGSGTDWSWQPVSGTTSAVDGAIAEFKIPRSSLGNPSNYRAVFKARNSPFTGDFSESGIDTYPSETFAPVTIHDDLLYRQYAIWTESGGTLSMRFTNSASAGENQLLLDDSYDLSDGQLITYLSSNGEYYTAQVDQANGRTVTLKRSLEAPVSAGQNLWNFYEDDSHPNERGYRAIADFAIRQVGISNLNTGTHVMLGDSWFDSPGVAERLSVRLGNAQVINEGIGGNTSTNMLNRFDADVTPHNPDFVWVIAGVNDYFQETTPATYLANMQGIMAKISGIGAEAVIFDSPVAQLFFGSDSLTQISHAYSEALSGLGGGGGFVDYELGEVVARLETGDISNPKSINIDGNLSDWDELQSFGEDGDDISQAGARADILEAWMAHDDSTFYVAYLNDGDVDQSTWWPWQVYLDTDKDENTGFKSGNGVGANYLIQANGLYQYIGNGSDWAWRFVAAANSNVNGAIVELAFQRSDIGNPSSLSALMKARNDIFSGNFDASGLDTYPNIGSGRFSYLFGEDSTGPTVTSNKLNNGSITLNGDLSDWSTTTSFGRDGDDITVANAQADWIETWAAHDDNNLYFAYENDGDISSTAWPYQIYIDVDNNPETGFKVTGGLGAEYVLEGSTLRSYTGTGTNWAWGTFSVTESATDSEFSEIAIPRRIFNGVNDFRVVFKARNQPFTGSFDPSGVDYFPNNAVTSSQGYFSYSME